jgi:hypothetical protein
MSISNFQKFKKHKRRNYERTTLRKLKKQLGFDKYFKKHYLNPNKCYYLNVSPIINLPIITFTLVHPKIKLKQLSSKNYKKVMFRTWLIKPS